MRVTFDITDEEIKKAVIDKMAQDISWKFKEQSEKIFSAIEWSKMTPHVQEVMMKLAAETIFNTACDSHPRFPGRR